MRREIKLWRINESYVLDLTFEQASACRECVAFAVEKSFGEKERSALQFGSSPQSLRELRQKLSGLRSNNGIERIVELTSDDLHSLYVALISSPSFFSHEEDFYIRIGHFKEAVLQLAAGLREAEPMGGQPPPLS
jgi:hypothetical protein